MLELKASLILALPLNTLRHMQTRMLKLIAIISFTFLSACSSAPPVQSTLPDWVNAPKKLFPETRYLSAVGTGKNRNEAILDAKKLIAESLITQVRSERFSHTQGSLNQNSSGQTESQTQRQDQQSLSLTTDTFVRGAEVKEVFSTLNETYALIALDKLSARSGLMLEANKIQSKLQGLLDELEQNFNTSLLIQAQGQLTQLEKLETEAGALGLSALVDAASPRARLAKLESGQRDQFKNISFVVKTLQGETHFERDLENCINDTGGTLYQEDQAQDSSLKVELSVVERKQHLNIDGFQKFRFDLSAQVLEKAGKKYRIQASETESGRSREAILESVSQKLSTKICSELFRRVSEMKR